MKAAPESPPPEGAETERHTRLAVLLLATAQGDARAFEEFYSLTISLATALVRRIAGSNYTEDVLSDAYFQAWRQAQRFNAQRGTAVTWLLSIARSRALDRLRAEKLRHAGMEGAPEIDENSITDPLEPGPDTLLERTQTASRLHGAMSELSANERWVLGLAYYRDLSHSEIASITDLPLGTVKSLVSRSQRKLRLAIEPAPQVSMRPCPR